MSYGAGRGVNVSQYLRNLNVQEPAVEETLITDEDLAKDLALFTNTQFYDFETGQHTDYQAPPVKPESVRSPTEDVTPTDAMMGEFPANFDFMSGDFSFGDFSSTYTSPTIPAFPDALANHLQPIQPNPQAAYAPPVPQQQHPGLPNRVLSFEEVSRVAAEEDKRKRNTAASARFRIKKKQREQALEKSAKEMTDKVTKLEGRISALETENKWLKSLVTEKHGGKDDILQKLLKEFAAREEQEATNGEVRDSIVAAGDKRKD